MLAEEMHGSPLERYICHTRRGDFEAAWEISDSIVRERVSTPLGRRQRPAKCLRVWTLLRADSDWRWMEHRDDNPWYPTMRLFWQRRAGAWEPVIERVAVELDKMARATRANGAPSSLA
jgi:hypothetical protein